MSDVALSSVIQLSPHGESEKVTVLSKTEEGEDLISLDDLYENTGQESLKVIQRSAKEFFGKGRLHRDSFSALKISGTESFLPIYDKHNARMGGESFVSRLKEGFVAIIKAVRKWLGAVIDWAIVKLKSLFGFSKTEKEIAAAEQHMEKLKPLLRNFMIRAFGGTQEAVSFNLEEFMETLPQGVTGKEVMTIVKNRAQSAGDVVNAMNKASADIEKAYQLLIEGSQKARNVKNNYVRITDNFKRIVKSKNVTEADVINFTSELDKLVVENLDPTKYAEMAKRLVEQIYDIEIKDLGVETSFKNISDLLKTNLEQTKQAISEDHIALYKELQKSYIKRVNENEYHRITGFDYANLKDAVDDKFAVLLDSVVQMYPEHVGLIGSYMAFSNAITNFNESVNLISEVLQRCAVTTASVSKWITSLQTLGMAYVAQDVEKIIQAHQETTPGHEDEFFSKNSDGSLNLPRLLPDDTKVLKAYYPGLDLKQEAIDTVRILRELPQVKTPINNLLKELGLPMKV
ncbi:hypothetical protein [Aeromonas phage AerS_266]|nr:hypothetical protein [Aeromonas phage AerS_266]